MPLACLNLGVRKDDSMINLKPSQGNRSRYVEDKSVRKKIVEIVNKRIKR